MKFINYVKRLDEKQIIFYGTKGKKYGNIVILAGGAASGKGFARTKFIEGNLFKIRDIDDVKTMFLKIAELKNKYPEIRGLDLTKAEDVFKLHKFVAARKIKEKTFDLLMQDANSAHLPNIMFDITFRDLKAARFDWIKKMIDELGYSPLDVNLVWVLTNYEIAMKQNLDPSRGRVVPNDILLQTHEGAANNMISIIKGTVPEIKDKSLFNGAIYVILNNKENTIFWKNSKGETIKTKPTQKQIELYHATKGKQGALPLPVIKDFKYLTLKKKGEPITTDKDVLNQLYQWIIDNVPPNVMWHDIAEK